MSNILKVTTPVAGYENTNSVRTNPVRNTDPAIQGQVNPEKVMKPDARSDSASQDQNVGLKFQYESNYDNFIQQMREMPAMAEEFSKLFFERFSTLAESGLQDGYAQQIAEFLAMVDVEPQELLAFVKGQGNASIRFNGAFFTLLRQVMEQTNSVELKSLVLDFVRRYTDMAESPHIMHNIGHLLETLKGKMFQDAGEQLESMSGELNYKAGAGSSGMEENASILKEKILPFLNRYISGTHDRGTLRDMTAQLAAYTARCENSSGVRLMEAFGELMKFQGMQKYFQGFDPAMLMQVLGNTEFEKSVRQQKWMDKLASLIDEGVSGAAGSENKAVFRNLMQAVLLNESVYMPVLHMMIPLQMNGRLMFAEMWIDPDAEGDRREEDGSRKRTVQGLVKFDVQDVGFFDLYFIYRDGNIRLQMNCPEALDEGLDAIRRDITQILAENEIKTEELFVESGQRSIPVSEAFPKIFERKNSINVRI